MSDQATIVSEAKFWTLVKNLTQHFKLFDSDAAAAMATSAHSFIVGNDPTAKAVYLNFIDRRGRLQNVLQILLHDPLITPEAAKAITDVYPALAVVLSPAVVHEVVPPAAATPTVNPVVIPASAPTPVA